MKIVIFISTLILGMGCHGSGDGSRPSAAPPATASTSVAESSADTRGSGAESLDASVVGAQAPSTYEQDVESDANLAIVSRAVGSTKAGGPLPGPCYDPARHARIVERLQRDFPVDRSELDLDGDGQGDAVILGGASGVERTMHLYVMRGPCGYHVGDLVGPFMTPKPLKTRAHGLYDLRAGAVAAAVCCSPADEWTWRFDGAKYGAPSVRKVKRTCPLDPSPPACSPHPP